MAMRLDDGTTRRSAATQRKATANVVARYAPKPAGYAQALASLRAANPGVAPYAVRQALDDSGRMSSAPRSTSSSSSRSSGSSGGSSRGRSYGYSYGRGGGGGGGGGGSGTADAKARLNYLKSLLGSGAFTAKRRDDLRTNVNEATAADLASANSAYDALGQQIGVGADPYANMTTAGAQSRGGQEGADAYGAFQNVLRILSAARGQDIDSQRLAMGMGRRQATEQLGGFQRAALQSIANQEAAAQRALDQQRLQVALQLAELVGSGVAAPTPQELGL